MGRLAFVVVSSMTVDGEEIRSMKKRAHPRDSVDFVTYEDLHTHRLHVASCDNLGVGTDKSPVAPAMALERENPPQKTGS